jgi:hypothetical protein
MHANRNSIKMSKLPLCMRMLSLSNTRLITSLHVTVFVCVWLIVSHISHAQGPVMSIVPFSPVPVDLSSRGFEAYPLEGRVESLLDTPMPDGWQPTGMTRDLYLDLSERIIHMAVKWVDSKGAVIDPVTGEEWKQTTPRFVSSAAVLIAMGRCTEYLDTVCRAMAYCCKRLAHRKANDMSPDFWTRELMTADMCLTGIAPADLQQAWREDLSQLDCEKTYHFVDPTHGKKLHELHNWAIYASGGEALREMAGLGPQDRRYLWGREYFDMYMEPQLDHMTDMGMYRDPGDPITYDITTRLQFTIPLAYGFQSKLRDTYVELQRRGSLTALLFAEADGYVPFGGRSAGFQFQEIILSAIFELEAQRYKTTNPKLAGAFKRQAHRSAMATQRWLADMEPLRHIKNGFDPDTRHGTDAYGQYSVYTLLTSSFLGLSAMFADDSIAEAPTPAELGGYAIELKPAFNKIFAATHSSHVEIDTCADQHYDATGIGRVHFAGTPIEMVLGMPFAANHPKYNFAPGTHHAPMPIAIAPTWQTRDGWITLAAMAKGDVTHNTQITQQSSEKVELTIEYKHPKSHSQVHESLTLLPDALKIQTQINVSNKPAKHVVYQVPVLVTDGMSQSHITLHDGSLQGVYMEHRWAVTWDATQAKATLGSDTFANRNGVYRLLSLDFGDHLVAIEIHNLGSKQ